VLYGGVLWSGELRGPILHDESSPYRQGPRSAVGLAIAMAAIGDWRAVFCFVCVGFVLAFLI
jgi:hypothetical protein